MSAAEDIAVKSDTRRVQGISAHEFVSSTVGSVAQKFFPQVTFDRLRRQQYGCEVVSSLPFQMVVYFTAFYFPCWFVSSTVMLYLKFGHVTPLFQVILVAIYIAVPLTEVIRLYAGYVGNLEEKVPELAGSWLLTLLLQVPLITFLLAVPGTFLLPLDYATHALYFILLIFHLIFGYRAIIETASHQAKIYHAYSMMKNDD